MRNKENFEEVVVTAKVCYFPCKVARCCLRRFHVRMLEKQREIRGGGGYYVVGYFPFKDARSFLQRFQVRMFPRRATLLFAPSRTDGPIGRNPREKVLSLFLCKNLKFQPTASPPAHCRFCASNWGRKLFTNFVLLSFTIPLIPIMSLSFGILILGLI